MAQLPTPNGERQQEQEQQQSVVSSNNKNENGTGVNHGSTANNSNNNNNGNNNGILFDPFKKYSQYLDPSTNELVYLYRASQPMMTISYNPDGTVTQTEMLFMANGREIEAYTNAIEARRLGKLNVILPRVNTRCAQLFNTPNGPVIAPMPPLLSFDSMTPQFMSQVQPIPNNMTSMTSAAPQPQPMPMTQNTTNINNINNNNTKNNMNTNTMITQRQQGQQVQQVQQSVGSQTQQQTQSMAHNEYNGAQVTQSNNEIEMNGNEDRIPPLPQPTEINSNININNDNVINDNYINNSNNNSNNNYNNNNEAMATATATVTTVNAALSTHATNTNNINNNNVGTNNNSNLNINQNENENMLSVNRSGNVRKPKRKPMSFKDITTKHSSYAPSNASTHGNNTHTGNNTSYPASSANVSMSGQSSHYTHSENMNNKNREHDKALLKLFDIWQRKKNKSETGRFNVESFVFGKFGCKARGIQNRSVDCYFNAILQCLLSFPLFVALFSHLDEKESEKIGPCCFAVHEMISQFCVKKPFVGNNQFGSMVFHSSSMIQCLEQFHRFLGVGHNQQDAHEFLHWLIEQLHEEFTWKHLCKDRNRKHKKNHRHKTRNQNQNNNNNNTNSNNKENNEYNKNDELKEKEKESENKENETSEEQINDMKFDESMISLLFGGQYYQLIKLTSIMTQSQQDESTKSSKKSNKLITDNKGSSVAAATNAWQNGNNAYYSSQPWSTSGSSRKNKKKGKNKNKPNSNPWNITNLNNNNSNNNNNNNDNKSNENPKMKKLTAADILKQKMGNKNKENEAKSMLTNMTDSESFHPFFILSLDINNIQVNDINKALYCSLQNSNVSGLRRGDHLFNGTKMLRISRPLPQYLILHLKRFSFESTFQTSIKNSKHIAFDDTLYISNQLIYDKYDKYDNNKNNKNDDSGIKYNKQARSKYKYQLRSVIVHHGDHVSHGHYTSFCKRDNIRINDNRGKKGNNSNNSVKDDENDTKINLSNKSKKMKNFKIENEKENENVKYIWLQFNDDDVKQVNFDIVRSQQAYILMYAKVH